MKRILVTLALLTLTLVPAMAQKIDMEASDRTRIVHLNFLRHRVCFHHVDYPPPAQLDESHFCHFPFTPGTNWLD